MGINNTCQTAIQKKLRMIQVGILTVKNSSQIIKGESIVVSKTLMWIHCQEKILVWSLILMLNTNCLIWKIKYCLNWIWKMILNPNHSIKSSINLLNWSMKRTTLHNLKLLKIISWIHKLMKLCLQALILKQIS